ncbi:unnamed protein product [Brassicogethes aeneus]|uniref:CBP80/20-dependent translation initiation factor n=1 Tax=Brassicogethes aeneus TaxID=1431903 RepID=A0A9P0AYC2_BRAAE|nr:unnamed protein product [Brassicogethes aeneus]
MSRQTSGGRGRGWLNVYKSNSAPIQPGIVPEPVINNAKPVDNTKFVDAREEYMDLANKVKKLNVNDDGILFNQKIKYILENWKECCSNGEEVEKSFEYLYEACLQDIDLASKTVLMISSRTFISQEVHDQNIRMMFLRKLQEIFEGCHQLQKSNPIAFRNSIQILGEFYNKARLANGEQFTFMASPLVSYLDMLLEATNVDDLKLFTTQLYLNGSSIKNEIPEKIIEIIIKVRQLLSSDKKIVRDGKLWLLLALEVSNNRFTILPAEAHSFYQEMLGDAAMATLQGTHGALSVQTTHVSKTLDSYQSNVNVLQVSTPPETPVEDQIIAPIGQMDLNTTNYSTSSGISSDSSQNSFNRREHKNNMNKPGGRPILGAGARFNKHKGSEEGGSWRDQNKDASAGGNWNNKQKGWNDNKKGGNNPPKTGKGWEHDDRFETDYS